MPLLLLHGYYYYLYYYYYYYYHYYHAAIIIIIVIVVIIIFIVIIIIIIRSAASARNETYERTFRNSRDITRGARRASSLPLPRGSKLLSLVAELNPMAVAVSTCVSSLENRETSASAGSFLNEFTGIKSRRIDRHASLRRGSVSRKTGPPAEFFVSPIAEELPTRRSCAPAYLAPPSAKTHSQRFPSPVFACSLRGTRKIAARPVSPVTDYFLRIFLTPPFSLPRLFRRN